MYLALTNITSITCSASTTSYYHEHTSMSESLLQIFFFVVNRIYIVKELYHAAIT